MPTGPAGETVDTPRHRALASPSRAAILRLVRLAPAGLTIAEVATASGLHASTARDHLDRLVEARLLVRERAPGGVPGRPAWRYRSAAPEPAPGPYRALAAVLLGHLSEHGDGAATAGRVGEGWGRRLAAEASTSGDRAGRPVDTLLRVLDRLGFDPHPVPDGHREHSEHSEHGLSGVLHLRACPFLELVAGNAEAMCGVHRGVIRGALTAGGAPGAAATAVLEPFGAPDACVVRLAGGGEADAEVAR